MPLKPDVVRLKIERRNRSSPIDVLSNGSLVAWKSSSLRIELGIFLAGLVENINNLESLTLEIKPQGASGGAPTPATAPLASRTITSFDNTLDIATWTAGTKQHAVVEFTDDEMDIAAGNQWLVVACTLTDYPSETITLAAGACEILEDGFDDAGSAPVLDNSAYTKAQSDARYPLKAGVLQYLPGVTGLTGGTSANLDGAVVSADWTLLSTFLVIISDLPEIWRLEAGTDAEDAAAGIVRPDDYATTTNERVLKRKLLLA